MNSSRQRAVQHVHPQQAPAATTCTEDVASVAPQPQPSCPAALASASLTQQASAPAGAGPPQHPVAATSPARLSASTRSLLRADAATLTPTGVRAIRFAAPTGVASVGPQHDDAAP